ncbi:hypothetical protein AB0C86_37990 [Streptomyces lavendulae]|uniref:hypothetical protein n=1 Tax=Streptomyces lavendulae TaxID=1914 RepID=UPI0033E1057F
MIHSLATSENSGWKRLTDDHGLLERPKGFVMMAVYYTRAGNVYWVDSWSVLNVVEPIGGGRLVNIGNRRHRGRTWRPPPGVGRLGFVEVSVAEHREEDVITVGY